MNLPVWVLLEFLQLLVLLEFLQLLVLLLLLELLVLLERLQLLHVVPAFLFCSRWAFYLARAPGLRRSCLTRIVPCAML